MALEGTLKDFSLADIFQLIGIQKKTGVLTLKNDEDMVTVSFLNGNVVAADSLPRKLEDRLGRVLVKSGAITEEQLRTALDRQKLTLQRMGHVLVNEGFIGKEDLREALNVQVTQLIFRLFRWQDGNYKFNQEDHLDFDRQNFQPIQAETILMEGARILDEWPLIEKKLKSFSMVFRKTDPDRKVTVAREEEDDSFDLFEEKESAPKGAGKDEVGEKEAIVYALVNGKRMVQDLIDTCRFSEFDTCKALFDLLESGLIETILEKKIKTVDRQKGAGRLFSIRLTPGMRAAGQAILIVAAMVLLATSSWNPLGFSPPPLKNTREMLSRFALASSRARLERIQYGLEVFYLEKGRFPRSLEVLAQGEFLSEKSLLDPWGQKYHFEILDIGYRLWGTDASGQIPSELNFEYRFPRARSGVTEIAYRP